MAAAAAAEAVASTLDMRHTQVAGVVVGSHKRVEGSRVLRLPMTAEERRRLRELGLHQPPPG